MPSSRTSRALSDEQLRAKTEEFKDRLLDRLTQAETLDDLLPEAFAVVREAAKRVIGQRHFDVQMIGGMVLHQGRIAEMKTGEGKTLIATLPLYLNALEGKGAHLVTVNDYLAKCHAQWMGPIYDFLGHERRRDSGIERRDRRAGGSYIYDPDYVNEDEPIYPNLRRVRQAARPTRRTSPTAPTTSSGSTTCATTWRSRSEELVQRELHYAIVDEVDSILIDEARTPLIISGQADAVHRSVLQDGPRGVPAGHRDATTRSTRRPRPPCSPTTASHKVEQGIGVENLADDPELMHHANAALKARTVFKKDIDYVVKGDGQQVIIVDEFTGRLMFGRRYGDGLHQAIEAKEGVKIEHESQTLATITYQNYFRLYDKLAGMTGTAKTEEEEFRKIYGLDVVDHPDEQADDPRGQPGRDLQDRGGEVPRHHHRDPEAAQQAAAGAGGYSLDRDVRARERAACSRRSCSLLAATFVLRQMLEEAKNIDGDTQEAVPAAAEREVRRADPRAGWSRSAGRSAHRMDMLTPENVERLASHHRSRATDGDRAADGVPGGGHRAQRPERQVPRDGSPDHRRRRPAGRGDDRHQHGRSRR